MTRNDRLMNQRAPLNGVPFGPEAVAVLRENFPRMRGAALRRVLESEYGAHDLVTDKPRPISALVPLTPREEQEGKAREAARDQYQREGEVEIDDNARCSHSDPRKGGDGGYYVQAWVWVEGCRKCGHVYDDGGDGYDGMCPRCADRAENAGEQE